MRATPCHGTRRHFMPIRCVYTDLDGTLLGRGASLFRTAEGDFTLLAARALEALHRAGAEVVLKSGRRRAQVMEDARLLGQSAYIFEVGSGLVIDGEVTFLTGDWQPREGETIHQQIAATGAPDLLLRHYEGRLEPHTPWAHDREVSHLFRGSIDALEANELLAAEGHDGLRLVDNGEIGPQLHGFHLIPAGTSKAAAVAVHMRARGYAPERLHRHRRLARGSRRGGQRGPLLPRGQRSGRRHERPPERRAHRGRHERGLLRGRDQGAGRVAVKVLARTRNRSYNQGTTAAAQRRRTGEAARAPLAGRPSQSTGPRQR